MTSGWTPTPLAPPSGQLGWRAPVYLTTGAGLMAATARMLTPNLVMLVVIAPPNLAAVAVFQTPTVTLTVPAVMAPTMQATATMPTPFVASGTPVAAAVMAAVAQFRTPTLSTGVSLGAPVMVAMAAALAPGVGIGYPQTSPVMAAVAQLLTPTVGFGISLTAPLMTSLAAMLAPTVNIGLGTAPLMTAAAQMLTPALSAGVNVGGAGWTPAQLPALGGWIDPAQDTATYANNQSVTSYTEHSPNHYVFTSASAPTFLTSSVNGKPRLSFTGSNLVYSGTWTPSSTGMALILVMQHPTGTGAQLMNSGGSADQSIGADTTTNTLYFYAEHLGSSASVTFTANTDYLAIMNYDATGKLATVYFNGSQVGTITTSGAAPAAGAMRLGAYWTGSSGAATGLLAEAMWVGQLLSPADLASVTQYLQYKHFGIGSPGGAPLMLANAAMPTPILGVGKTLAAPLLPATATMPTPTVTVSAPPAPAFDALGTGIAKASYLSAATGSITVTAGANIFAVVAVQTNGLIGTMPTFITSVKAGSSSTLTLLDSIQDSNNSGVVGFYRLTAAPGGTQTMTVTPNAGQTFAAYFISFTGVSAVSAAQKTSDGGTPGNNLTQALTCSTNQMILQSFQNYYGGTLSGYSGGTGRSNTGGLTLSTATATTTFTATAPSKSYWSGMGVVLS